jgi:cell division control protein 6
MKKNLLMWDESLFRDLDVLEIDYVPEQFEYRDTQMRELAYAGNRCRRGRFDTDSTLS